MLFYGYFRSSAAYRCRIGFNLKGLSPETAYIHLRKGEQRRADFLALNPQGLVPTLAQGGHILTQSLAILEWLEEAHPNPPLLPGDALERAEIRSLALLIACDIHPLHNLRVLAHLREGLGQDQAGLDAWCRRFIESGLLAYETRLAQLDRAGAFSFGDAPTLADCCLIPQLYAAERFGADLTAMSRIRAIAAHAAEHPAFAAAHPSRQPDNDV